VDRDDEDLGEGRGDRSQVNGATVAGGAAMRTDLVRMSLAIRRAAGFVLRCEDFQLKSFATFSAARGQQHVTADLAIEWAGCASSMAQRARRLGTIIRFARYARAEDPRHQVPSPIFGAEKLPRRGPDTPTAGHNRRQIEDRT